MKSLAIFIIDQRKWLVFNVVSIYLLLYIIIAKQCFHLWNVKKYVLWGETYDASDEEMKIIRCCAYHIWAGFSAVKAQTLSQNFPPGYSIYRYNDSQKAYFFKTRFYIAIGAGGLRFDFRASQIGYSAINDSPPLRRSFAKPPLRWVPPLVKRLEYVSIKIRF